MKEENSGTSPTKKKWTKKGYNPDAWSPDLVGVSEVVPCSLWRLATTQRNSSTSAEYRVPTMVGPHPSASGALDVDGAAMAFPFAFLGAIGARGRWRSKKRERKVRQEFLEAEAQGCK